MVISRDPDDSPPGVRERKALHASDAVEPQAEIQSKGLIKATEPQGDLRPDELIPGVHFHLKPGTPLERWATPRDPIRSPEIPTLVENALVPRLYFSLEEAARIIGVTPADVLHFAGVGRIRLHIPVPDDIEIRPLDGFSQRYGAPHLGLEMLSLSTTYCRKLELNGQVAAAGFGDGWQIDRKGYAFSVSAEGFDETLEGNAIVWASFNDEEFAKIDVTPEKIFLFSFDIDAFLKNTYRAPETVVPESLIAPDGHAFESADLVTMRRAARIFWGPVRTREKGSYPRTVVIKDWLMKNGFTDNTADAAVTILRPEFAQTGTRRIKPPKRAP